MEKVNKGSEMWSRLEQFINPATVMAEWQAVFGADFANAKGFLRATDKQAAEYPCINRPPCGCDHEVIAHAPDRIVAACRCEPAECKIINLQPKDILIYALDSRKFCRAIRAALNFDAPPDERVLIPSAPHAWPVGMYGALRSPVYLLIRPTESEFLKEIEGLITGQMGPFILFAPTERHHTPTMHAVLQRQKAVFIPVSHTLALVGSGLFKPTNSIQPILDRFTQGLTEGKELGKTVEKIGRDMDAMAKGQYELRKENEELRQLHTSGFLKFSEKVNAKDFSDFAAIMVKGNRKAAAESLNIPYRSFYDRIAKWSMMGPDYKRIINLVAWRKKAGRKIIVRLPDSVLGTAKKNQPENPVIIKDIDQSNKDRAANEKDHSELLREILIALAEQNPQNWQNIRKELVEIITDEIPQ